MLRRAVRRAYRARYRSSASSLALPAWRADRAARRRRDGRPVRHAADRRGVNRAGRSARTSPSASACRTTRSPRPAPQMLVGGVGLLASGCWPGRPASSSPSTSAPSSVLSLIYLHALRQRPRLHRLHLAAACTLRVSRVSTYAYVNPVVAIFLGWLLLRETVDLTMILGAADDRRVGWTGHPHRVARRARRGGARGSAGFVRPAACRRDQRTRWSAGQSICVRPAGTFAGPPDRRRRSGRQYRRP